MLSLTSKVTNAEYKAMVLKSIARGDLPGSRNAATMAMNRATMSRGQASSNTVLGGLCVTSVGREHNEGVHNALIIVSDCGKVIGSGKQHKTSCLQHLDPCQCTHFLIADYLHGLYEEAMYITPDFTGKDWSQRPLFPGNLPNIVANERMSSGTMDVAIRELQQECFQGIWTSAKFELCKKQHAGRNVGHSDAVAAGVTDDDIRQVGGWGGEWDNPAFSSKNKSATRLDHYGDGTPQGGLKGLADCNLEKGYHHPRCARWSACAHAGMLCGRHSYALLDVCVLFRSCA